MTDSSGEPLKFGSYYILEIDNMGNPFISPTQYIGEEHNTNGELYYRFIEIRNEDGERGDDDTQIFPDENTRLRNERKIGHQHALGFPRLIPLNEIPENVVNTDEDLPTPSGGRRKKYRKTRNKKTYRKTRNKKTYRKTRKTRNKKRV